MNTPIILFWISGVLFGLMFCAFFACPHWQIATPAMLVLSIFIGRVAYNKMKSSGDS